MSTRREATRRPRQAPSPLHALSAAEKAAVLDDLLTGHPELREAAEALASRRLGDVDRTATAEQVAWALQTLPHERIGEHSGYQRGIGYVEPSEAAWQLLEEELEPFTDDLERRAKVGMKAAARELGLGILLGLYECEGYDKPETVLSWAEDFPGEEASVVFDQLRKLDIDLPDEFVAELLPRWVHLLRER